MLLRLSNDSVNPRPVSQRLCGHTRKTGYRPCLQTARRRGRAAGWLSSRAKRVSTGSAIPTLVTAKNAPKEPTEVRAVLAKAIAYDYRHARNRRVRLAPTLLTVTRLERCAPVPTLAAAHGKCTSTSWTQDSIEHQQPSPHRVPRC
jgi:hypothetical protein